MRSLNIKRFGIVFATSALMTFGFTFTACNNDDDNTKVEYDFLESFGPLPVARGGELTFIGHNLSNVVSVTFANGTTVDVNRINSGKFTITVPDDDAVAPGQLTLNMADGSTYKTKTECGFAEPITIKSLGAEVVKPGSALEINGRYLLQATEIGFAGDVKVSLEKDEDDKFVSENVVSVSDTKIVVKVPAEAITGKVVVTDGSNPVETEKEVKVVTPAFSKYTVNENLLRGKSELEIQGTDMDLVTDIKFSNGLVVSAADATVTESSIKFVLPINTPVCKPVLTTASGVQIEAAELALANPVFGEFTNNSGVYVDSPVEINGTNLDMVKSIVFVCPDGNVQTYDLQDADRADGKVTAIVPEKATSTMVWSNEASDNVGTGSLKAVLFSGEEMTLNDGKYCIGWPAIGNADKFVDGAFVYTSGDKVVMSGCTNTAYMTKLTVDGIVTPFDIISKDSYSFVWPLSSNGKDKLVQVDYTNGNNNTNQWGTHFTIAKTDKIFVQSYDEFTNAKSSKVIGGNFALVKKVIVDGIEQEFSATKDDVLFVSLSGVTHSPTKMILQGDGDAKLEIDVNVSGLSMFVTPKSIAEGNPDMKFPYKDSWGGAQCFMPASAIPASRVYKGNKFILHVTVDNGGGQIQINDPSWSSFATVAEWSNYGDQDLVLEINDKMIELYNGVGANDQWFIMQGSGITVNSIELLP